MPAHLKALVVILVLATAVFAFAKAPACALASTKGDFERRRNLWFGITLVAFFAHNFWIFIIIVAALLLLTVGREPNKLALYFFLLFAVPPFGAEITGLGVIRQFFEIHYLRLLSLTVLLPAFLFLRRQPDSERFGRSLPDKLLAGYLILICLLTLTVNSFTATLRSGVFYAFIDVFLPYYVASRSLKNLQGFRDALMGFVVAALVLSAIAAFEYPQFWLLYGNLDDALGAPWAYGYVPREGGLRATASAGHPITLGYVIAVALGFFLYLKKSVPNPLSWGLGLTLLLVGLIAPVSRGPWVGAAAILLVFVATGPSAATGFAKLGVLGIVVGLVLLATPLGEKIIKYLPFVGTVDESTIDFRQRLLEISIQVILQNPVFGGYDYIYAPVFQELKQGNGFLDIVNSYVGVALGSGLVGLSLFSGFFVAVAVGIFKGMRNLADRNDELYVLGQVLFSTLLGILVIIGTTSSIGVVPVIYWSVAGLGVAYGRMLALAKSPEKVPEPLRHARIQPAVIKNW
jgi:O-antigen ligase